MSKLKIGCLSLGCPRNIVDSENILGRLSLKNYSIVDMEKADVAIVNTCAFVEDAKKESIDAILDLISLKSQGRLKKIIVYGCLAQRYKDVLAKELPQIDAFVGRVSLNHSNAHFSITPRHYAYLKIAEGCVNNCSYCAIPKIKGRFASLDMQAVISKAQSLDAEGIAELNIIGQDISGYGLDLYKARRLPQLLRQLLGKTKHIPWIRLLYLYPDDIVDELLKIMQDEPRLCRYIDLPIQHINSRILKLMHRRPAPAKIRQLICRIRQALPDAALRTSLIVGFPSETDKEFRELLDFMQEVKFERLGAFMFSREEGTPAYNLKGQLPQKIKLERFNQVMSSQQEISRQINEGFMHKIMDVLIDEVSGDSYLGRSQYDAPEVDGQVYVKSKVILKPGDFVRVKIIDTLEYDLVGEAIK